MNPMIDVRAVTKRFGSFAAVDEVSLQIRAGEFLTLLGPSGCGKTTLLRLISGFEQPDAGAIWIAGEDVTGRPPYRRNVNQVFQSYALFPHLTVRENIAFGLRIAKEVSRLDIGQTVVVRNGTVLAVEGFEGTNDAIKRGALLGRGQAVAVKVSKPDQDFRFDVPVIGPLTLEAGAAGGLSALAVEAGRTLLVEPERLRALADEHKISILGVKP